MKPATWEPLDLFLFVFNIIPNCSRQAFSLLQSTKLSELFNFKNFSPTVSVDIDSPGSQSCCSPHHRASVDTWDAPKKIISYALKDLLLSFKV